MSERHRANTAGPHRVELSSVAVVAHPARSSFAQDVATRAGAEALCWDTTDMGCEPNHLTAWEWLAGTERPWGVVLEDDVDLVPDFVAQLGQVLAASPSPVVSLYLGRGTDEDWQGRISAKITADVCWLTAESMLSTQGYAIRTEHISDMLELVEPFALDSMSIHEAVSMWCHERGHLVAYSRPSIINHKDLPPLGKAKRKPPATKRTAWLYDSRTFWDTSATHLTNLKTSTVPAE